MQKDISISNFRKLPGAFLIFIAMVIITESAIYSLRPALIDDYWNKIIINDNALIKPPADYDYLIMGDSIQRTGIDPTLVSPGMLNIGLPGGKPPALYIMVQRYLEKHRPPKAIFLFVDPEDEHDSLLVALRYFISIPEVAGIWKDLTWEERLCFVMRYWASLDLRKTGLIVREKYLNSNESFIEMMKEKDGYVPSANADKIVSNDRLLKRLNIAQKKIKMDKRDMKYLDKLMKLAASKNIKIIFLGTLFPRTTYDIFERSGFNEDYLKFYDSLKRMYPQSYFVAKPILYLDDKYFGDPVHVNKAGAYIYTQYFKNQVFIPFIEKEGK